MRARINNARNSRHRSLDACVVFQQYRGNRDRPFEFLVAWFQLGLVLITR